MIHRLTSRQQEILQMYANGLSVKEVGFQLDIEESTVKSHTTTIYRKLRAADRAHAVAIAMREGLIT